tara:strand:+ start:1672 stop:4377 length:2706 start_codon:yes stop_codon:yes gene_type:complete
MNAKTEMTDEDKLKLYQYYKLKEQSGPITKVEEKKEVSGLDWTAELGREINRKSAGLFELAADIGDIPMAGARGLLGDQFGVNKDGKRNLSPKGVDVSQLNFPKALSNMWEQVNPMGDPSEVDRLRAEGYKKLIPEELSNKLTKKEIDDPVIAGLGYGYEALAGPGKLMQNLAVAGTSGLGGGIGNYLGGDTGGDIGAFAGAFTPITAIRKALGQGNQMVLEDVMEFIRKNARDPDAAMTNFKKNFDAGMKGTVADLAGDSGLYNIEAVVPKGTEASENLAQQISARAEQSGRDLRGSFGDGNVDDATRNAQGLIDQDISGANKAADYDINSALQAQADELSNIENANLNAQGDFDRAQGYVDGVDGRVTNNVQDPALSSSDAARKMQAVEDRIKTQDENPAWTNFRTMNTPYNGSNWRDTALSALDELDRTQIDFLKSKYGGIFEKIDNFELPAQKDPITGALMPRETRDIKPSEVHTVIKKIEDVFAAESYGGRTPSVETRELQLISKRLKSELGDFADQGDEAAQAYVDATVISRDKFDSLEFDTLKDARGEFSELYGKRLFKTGEEGSKTAKDLKRALNQSDPEAQKLAVEAVEAVKDYVRSLTINADNINAKWLKRYKPFLDEFPDLAAEMTNVVESRGGLVNATKELTSTINSSNSRTGALVKSTASAIDKAKNKAEGFAKSLKATNLGKFTEDATETISSILNQRDNSARDFKNLYDSVDDKEAFIGALGDTVSADLNQALTGGGKGLGAKTINKWESIKESIASVIPEEEMGKIDEIINRTKSEISRRSGSVQKVREARGVGEDIVTSAATAVIATNLPGGHPLMYGGKIKGWLNAVTKGGDKNEAALVEVISNPKKFNEMLNANPPTNQKEFHRLWNLFAIYGSEDAGTQEE